MKKILFLLLAPALLLSGCGKQAQAVPPAAIPTVSSAEAKIEPSETPVSLPATPMASEPTADPTLFGALGTGEIQAYAVETVADAIFKKAMDGFVAAGHIQEYQVTSVTIFPGTNGLLAEIIFNVRTTDPGWLAEGGTPANKDWLNDKCYRFDFSTTETEYQLKNQRFCG